MRTNLTQRQAFCRPPHPDSWYVSFDVGILCLTDGGRPQPENSRCPYVMRRLQGASGGEFSLPRHGAGDKKTLQLYLTLFVLNVRKRTITVNTAPSVFVAG